MKLPVCLTCSVAFLLIGCASQEANTLAISQKPAMNTGDRLSTAGVMTASDYNRLLNVDVGIHKDHKVSDEDLNFALGMLDSRPLKDVDKNKYERQRVALMFLSGRKELTHSQAEKLFLKLTPIAQSGPHWLALSALGCISSTQDPRTNGIILGIASTAHDKDVIVEANNILKGVK